MISHLRNPACRLFRDAAIAVVPTKADVDRLYIEEFLDRHREDIAGHVLEVHDAFSIEELLYTEALGLCEPGEAASLVESGDFDLGGQVGESPANVSIDECLDRG